MILSDWNTFCSFNHSFPWINYNINFMKMAMLFQYMPASFQLSMFNGIEGKQINFSFKKKYKIRHAFHFVLLSMTAHDYWILNTLLNFCFDFLVIFFLSNFFTHSLSGIKMFAPNLYHKKLQKRIYKLLKKNRRICVAIKQIVKGKPRNSISFFSIGCRPIWSDH